MRCCVVVLKFSVMPARIYLFEVRVRPEPRITVYPVILILSLASFDILGF